MNRRTFFSTAAATGLLARQRVMGANERVRVGLIGSGGRDTYVAEIAAKIREADIIFGCTDNHTSRALLNQMSYQYLMPYIDMGNRIAAREGRVTGGSGRVVVMTPLAPCLGW